MARVIHVGLLERGFRSEVLTSGTTISDRLVRRLGRTPVGFLAKSWLGATLAMEFKVLHVHHGESLLLLLLLRLRRRRPRILMMFHVDVRRREAANGHHLVAGRRFGPGGIRRLKHGIGEVVKPLLDRAGWVLADAVTVETERLVEELSDLRPRREIEMVPYGIGKAGENAGVKSDPVELLYVGTPGNRKRTHLLPMILRRVRERVPNARLRIVGFNQNADPQLADEGERLDVLSAVEFLGPMTAEEVVPFYRTANVLILPSAYEGLPMVLLEAMREGLVAVATNVSGHPEAIEHGVNGILVPVDDVDAMADKCAALLLDPDSAARMGEAALQTVATRFHIDRQLDSYAQLYERLSRRRTLD